MPKVYEQIKAHLMRKGYSEKEAKTSAARIFNADVRKPGQPPMTRNYEKTAANWKKRGGK